MKKIYSLILSFLLIIVSTSIKVEAAGFNSYASGPGNIYPGSTFSVTVGVSGAPELQGIEGQINYDSNLLDYISGKPVNGLSGNVGPRFSVYGFTKSGTFNVVQLTFKAKSGFTAGKSSVISISKVFGSDSVNDISGGNSSAKVNVIAKPTPKSGNNFLTSLTVSSGGIRFNKNTSSYSMVVDNSVTSVSLGAKAESAKARVSGTGSKNLAVYGNKLTVTVTAENGSKRYYTVNVVRKDKDGNTAPLAKNNNLASLSIEGCDLDFSADKTNYKCEVNNLVEKVEVKAASSDSKAKVKINNVEKLKVGENEISIVVTAENKEEKTYKINVVRSSDAPTVKVDELEEALKTLKAEEIIVNIDKKGVIKKDVLNQIKKNKKVLKVNSVDENDVINYIWKFDGSSIDNLSDVNLNLNFISKSSDKIDLLSNYAKGLNLVFAKNPSLPKNTEVGIFVGDNYKDNSLINLYSYDEKENTLSLEEKELKVEDGYIWLKLDHTSEYFITPANIVKASNNTYDIWMIATSVLSAILAVSLIINIKDRKKINRYKKRVKAKKENLDEVVFTNKLD